MRCTPLFILLLLSFGVYFNCLSGDFVYDDRDLLENQWFRDMRNIPSAFSTNIFAGSHDAQTTLNYYRPLSAIFGILNYSLFGLKPWGFHLVNMIFHCSVTVLVFLVVRRLLSGQETLPVPVYLSPPFMAAALFALHPIHTEAVAWISGRADIFFSFFYLLSFYLYVLYRDGAAGGYALSVLSFAAAAFSKEPAITLPLVLMAYDALFKRRDETSWKAVGRYIPYVVVAGIYLSMRYYALGGLAPTKTNAHLTTYEAIINVLPLFKDYLAGLLWPFQLNLFHPFRPIGSLFGAQGIISAIIAVLFLAGAVTAYRMDKMVLFSLLLVGIPLLPAFYIKGLTDQPFAERYLYLPSVGYVLFLAILLSRGSAKLLRSAAVLAAVFTVIAGAYAVGTVTRNNVWQNSFNLWSDTVRKAPDNADAHNNLGIAYASQGMWDDAVGEFRTTLRLRPNDVEAHNNLGLAYSSQNLWDSAVPEFQQAMRLNPQYAEAHNNLGIAYASKRLWEEAVVEFQTALRLNPDFAMAHRNLGLAYAAQGLRDRAAAEFRTALQLSPDDDVARRRLMEIETGPR